MKTALIFGGAPCSPRKQPPLPAAELVVCADAGLQLAKALGAKPDWVVGDFDSLGEVPADVPMEQFPSQKNDTDLLLAVKYGLSQGCDHFVIYGALGGRIDHLTANIQTLSFLAAQGAQGVLVDENHWITQQQGGSTAAYPKRQGMYFSLFAMGQQCTGVTVRGVQYPLTDAVLTASFPLGVSNVITADQAVVTVRKGTLLVIYAKDGTY